jgi:hypothetical protein
MHLLESQNYIQFSASYLKTMVLILTHAVINKDNKLIK